jgi:spermidine synthase
VDALVSASAIGLGALLLFGIQPVIAKRLLPWFGGSVAVWITCLVFFQTALLAGYLYAFALHRWLSAREQSIAHVVALALSLAALPRFLGAGWRAGPDGDPMLGVLSVLATTIGLPYVLLASTGPLLQAWLARRPGAAPPYRLFALSNLASLAALLGYPVLVEPSISWGRQAISWAVGYLAFMLLSVLAALRAARPHPPAPATAGDAGEPAAPRAADLALWTALAACGSLLLLALTAHITQQIVPAPLLWVVPLAAYLLTFVICFEWPWLYWRPIWLGLLPVALVGTSYLTRKGIGELAAIWNVLLFVAGLFACCMVCHGEIARRRPAPRYLTTYYLLIALGGALGGLFAGVAAPLWFRHLVELPLGLVLAALLWVIVTLDLVWPRFPRHFRLALVALLPFALGLYAAYVIDSARAGVSGYRVVLRSFYGQLAVQDGGISDTETSKRTLVHGGIIHGSQWRGRDHRRWPTTYYCETSGVGRALASLPTDRGRRVGLVGLGAGTLITYGRPGDVYRVYEINPLVLRLAETEFTYLEDSRAEVAVILGDARRRLEGEPPQRFDLLAVDAFSGDSIPAHLLTEEALALYLRHLAPGGVLALHVSNRFVDFDPVLAAGAQALGRPAINALDDGDLERQCYHSQWIMIPAVPGGAMAASLTELGKPLAPKPGFRQWTDDRWSLYPVLQTGLE